MQRNHAWVPGLTGLGAGLATWLISEPFVTTVAKQGTFTPFGSFTLGSFYGWFAHLLLGALIAGSLAFVISLSRTSARTALVAGLLGAVVGGVLVCGADAFCDWLVISTLPKSFTLTGSPIMSIAPILWHVLTSIALAFAITIAAQPTAARFRRALAAGLLAAIAGYMTRQVLGPLEEFRVLLDPDLPKPKSDSLEDLINAASLSVWRPWSIARLLEWMSLGVIMGVALSLSDIFMRSATVRLETGRGAGNTYPLDNGPNRIGTAEGLEVRLPHQEGLQPIHAIIDARQGHWAITDLSGQGILVNGYHVHEALYQEGDVAQVGPCLLRLFLGLEGRSVAYEQPEVVLLDTPTRVQETPRDHRLIDPFGGIIQLPQGNSILGRGAAAQIRLDYDGRISHQHALLQVSPGTATLSSLDPANLTSVNGHHVSNPVELQSGDRILVGATSLQYRS